MITVQDFIPEAHHPSMCLCYNLHSSQILKIIGTGTGVIWFIISSFLLFSSDFEVRMLVFSCYCNKLSQMHQLNTIRLHYFLALELRSQDTVWLTSLLLQGLNQGIPGQQSWLNPVGENPLQSFWVAGLRSFLLSWLLVKERPLLRQATWILSHVFPMIFLQQKQRVPHAFNLFPFATHPCLSQCF